MEYALAVEIISKMQNKLKNNRPSWYEAATEEEKSSFEKTNAEKIGALDCALKCIKAHKQLERAATYINTMLGAENNE